MTLYIQPTNEMGRQSYRYCGFVALDIKVMKETFRPLDHLQDWVKACTTHYLIFNNLAKKF